MRRSVLIGLLLLGLPGSSFSPELRPHIGGVYSVTIKTSQLDKAKHFYEEDLRLPRARECLTEKAESFMVGPFQRIEISANNATSGASMIEALAFSINIATARRKYLMHQGLTPATLI